LPAIVISVPPAGVPAFGDTDVMTGAGTAS
jgi:hypothetical protein